MTSSHITCRLSLPHSKLECQFYDGHQYNNSSGPQTLTIVCETLDVGGPSETKTFMLDAGRLQLQPIKHAFNLVTVELMLGKTNGHKIRKKYNTKFCKYFRPNFCFYFIFQMGFRVF